MDMTKKRYRYCGAVKQFNTIVMRNFEAETSAVSITKARSNIEYQAKNILNLLPTAYVKLCGKIIEL